MKKWLISVLLLSMTADAQVDTHPTIHHKIISDLTEKARTYEQRQDTETALKYHHSALKVSQQAQMPEHQIRSLVNIASLLRNRYADSSLLYLDRALHIAHSIHHHELKSVIYRGISEIHKQQENYKEALAALEEHHRVIDTLLEKNRLRDIALMETQNARTLERGIAATTIVAILIIVVVVWFYIKRTRALTQRLRNSIAVRDKLFSILAHDLRGPAGNLSMALELMQSSELAADQRREIMEGLQKQSKSLTETLDNLLIWARSQLNGVTANPQTISPFYAVNKTVVLMSGQAQQKNISIQVNIPQELTVQADPDQFDFIFRNLLSNAIKFSYSGGRIEIDSVKKNETVLFSVTDHGIGITADKQQSFHTQNLDSSFGTAGEKGTGLGLLLVRDFVTANHGQLTLHSDAKEGTVFSFSLPA